MGRDGYYGNTSCPGREIEEAETRFFFVGRSYDGGASEVARVVERLSSGDGEDRMKELIEQIIKAMVDNPTAVEVREVQGEGTIVLELRVAKEDAGKVIGRKGRNAEAIRTILNAAGAKLKKKVELQILEQ